MNKLEKEQRIKDILERGVEDMFVKESLEADLRSDKVLRVKLGFDPTSPNVHLGRAITLRKLKAFQDLGHQVVFIVGDFTALIGDASDKLEKRPMLTEEAVKKNLQTYKDQIGKIIDLSKAEFHHNADWLSKLTFKEVAELAETFTVQQMTSRRNFKERIENGSEISLREFLYPLMQGYDSVMVKADVELGGFDQLFNVKAGRVIQRYHKMKEQNCLVTQMLEGTDGRKMSSSWGNVISILDTPQDMYGKLMSVHDSLIIKYLLLTTELSQEEIADLGKKMSEGENPRNIKMRLAKEVVTLYHGLDAALKAEEGFINAFQKGGVPSEVQEVTAEKGALLKDVLLKEEIISSMTEWRRLVTEGAVKKGENFDSVENTHEEVTDNTIYKIGKKRFLKVTIS